MPVVPTRLGVKSPVGMGPAVIQMLGSFPALALQWLSQEGVRGETEGYGVCHVPDVERDAGFFDEPC